MNSRQRFLATMAYGRPDRVPFFEEGIRDEVLVSWREQGMPPDQPLETFVPIDRRVEIMPELDPNPEPDHWPETTADLAEYKRSLDPRDPWRLPEDWPVIVEGRERMDQPYLLRVHRGLYQTLGVQGWGRFEAINIAFKEEPELVAEMLKIQADFAARLAADLLDQVSIDGAIFSEPINGRGGPLISPTMFAHFAGISYGPLLEVLREHGVETLIWRTYANARMLLPVVVSMGFNCLWACEVEVDAMDYWQIRATYGRDLRLIGGIDVDVLRRDREAIDREVEQKVPPLLAGGGFIPLADGRVRAVVPYENYIYYRQLLAQLAGQLRPYHQPL